VALGVLGAVGLAVAVGGTGLANYVSESGVPGSGHSVLYRASVLAVAACAALTATLGLPRLTAIVLAAAAPMIGLSAAVTCTEGCPLPPYEESTPSDLIHAAGSIAGVGLCALAMATLAFAPAGRGLAPRNIHLSPRSSRLSPPSSRFSAPGSGRMRSASLIAVAVGWPLLLATAVGIAVVGRSAYTGSVERLSLAVCLVWLVTVAALSRSDAAAAAAAAAAAEKDQADIQASR
jgi:hypothetical protein